MPVPICIIQSTPVLPAAVRTGNLAKFNQVLDQFGEKFQADGTYTLIIRLRHNVIKTGVDQDLRGCWRSRSQAGANLVGILGQVKGLCPPCPPHRSFLSQVYA